MNSTLTLTQEWDKTFPQNDAVDHSKVTFHNRFGIELAADLYKPKNAAGKLAAVAVSGPFGAALSAMPPQPQMPRMPMRSGSTSARTDRKSTAAEKSSVLMSGEAT